MVVHAMNVSDIRQLFPGLKDTIYLNTATMNVGCAPPGRPTNWRSGALVRRAVRLDGGRAGG